MSIPPISADLQAYFCQYGIPTGCHLSLLSSATFDWATVNPPPQLDFGQPLWATNGAAGHVAQHKSSSGMQGRVTRSMAQDDDIRGQMSLHSQLPPPALIMSGTTAKRKAPLDETDTRTVRRSNGVRATREDVHAAEAEAAEGLPLVPQMLAEAKVAQSITSKFNNGYQEDYFHMVHPFVQVVPASVAGPSHQLAMTGLDTPRTIQRRRKASKRKASARAKGKARGKRAAGVQAEDETEGEAKSTRAGTSRRKAPGNGPWVCELHKTKFGRSYDLARHNQTVHEGSGGPVQCECGALLCREDALARHKRSPMACPLRLRRR
ncbi:hypothetical protein HETIRDRAFT_165515 [Heterobasidion irregulare TC 32-1]|uniref:C2H2-type domain-containing protein n=1 Tax=Heterobasidion irregulare (strain TC 32-1) TaxID=747525 RepID=W4JXN9_HETIT|nr:uncharacterized protein HETIRDRAFT_165515 [Heterobasidion irregulare TC 32-1]ETW78332.1 hypothetical protein HETIRDRAFT_165515 [Heterobasidion irregulare TC 32-1]